MPAATCPWCSAPRADTPSCPHCGALRAEDAAVEDSQLEWKLCAAAIPSVLALGLFFHWLMPGLQRIFFGMPVHELGHAVSAWLCGYLAIPTLWKTLVPESRSYSAALALAAAL